MTDQEPAWASADGTNTHDIQDDLGFLLRLDGLKEIQRQNPLSTSDRRENVAEHSWHVAIAAMLMSGYAQEKIDVAQAVALAVVHDVVELLVGDTFAFGDGVADQAQREEAAMSRLDSHASPAVREMVRFWREYEEQQTPEARFVKGLDAVLPIALNFTNLGQSSWAKYGVEKEKVQARLDTHGDPGLLRGPAMQMIEAAHDKGVLK